MHSLHDVIIIGGGMAGLAAANTLIDAAITPLLFDEFSYPRHKVCGEFYSPECVSILQRWGINFPITISHARFRAGPIVHEHKLPQPASGLSRFSIENQLVERLKAKGGIVLEKARVKKLDRDDFEKQNCYRIVLASGECFSARAVIIATGRHSLFAQAHWQPFSQDTLPFIGLKMHVTGLDLGDCIEMHFLDKAYLGISAIEQGHTNISCLAQTDAVLRAGGVEKYMEALFLSTPFLAAHRSTMKPLFARWLTCGIPPFGVRAIPSWPSIYHVGDTFGSIVPLCGDGIAMATTSGVMAAHHLINNDWKHFTSVWKKRYARRLGLGNFLHTIMLKERHSKQALRLCNLFPPLFDAFFNLTREQ